MFVKKCIIIQVNCYIKVKKYILIYLYRYTLLLRVFRETINATKSFVVFFNS